MISIGGIIGAGVFVGSSTAISTIGPAVVLSYIFAGIVVFAVIKILARMALDQPGLGAFTEYVRVALGHGAGFISGWMYWWFWVIVVGIEAIAGAKIVHGWLPDFEVWQIGLGLMAVLTLVNLASARSYGEFEFWFASIKVAAIIVFIVVLACVVAWRRWTRESGLLESHGAGRLRALRLGGGLHRRDHRHLLDVRRGDRHRGRRRIGGVRQDHVAARRQRGGAHPAVLRARDLPHRLRGAVERVQVRRFHVLHGARAHRHSGRARSSWTASC